MSKAMRVVSAVIETSPDAVLIAQKMGRPSERYWEFPGGKIEPGETPKQALLREIQEELGITILVGRRLRMMNIDVPRSKDRGAFTIQLSFYLCQVVRGFPRPLTHAQIAIMRKAALRRQLNRLRFHDGDRIMALDWLGTSD